VTLNELVTQIAGQLGNSWRPGFHNYKSGRVPVIRNRDQVLVFGFSPEYPGQLRVTLLADAEHLPLDLPPDLGVGESAARIRRELIAVAYANAQPARREERARLTVWHKKWCRILTEHAETTKLSVKFTADTHGGVLVALHAAFYDFDPYEPVCTLTVTPGRFPVRIEYFTDPDTVRALITGQRPEAPPKQRRFLRRAT
jgi:hypothetical protein